MLYSTDWTSRRFQYPVGPVPRVGFTIFRIDPVGTATKQNYLLQIRIVGQLCSPKADINDSAGRFLRPRSGGAVPLPGIAGYADVAVLRINLTAINHDLRTGSVVGHAEIRSGDRHAAAARCDVRPGVGCHVIFPYIVATPGCIATAKENDPMTVRVVNHAMTASRAGLWSVRVGVEPVETLRHARQS